MTWGTFDEVAAVLDKYDGVGFVFCSADPYVGIDLDGCRDPETSEIKAWALEIIQGLVSYAEVSPSGTGVHVIAKAKVPTNVRSGKVEMYSSERFFTMTGQVLGGDGD
jgi:primase-polymerase (primpol)-like protein